LSGVKLLKEEEDFDDTASNLGLPPKPALLDATIRRRDESCSIVECTVVDCGTSTVSGDYYLLQGENGLKKKVKSVLISFSSLTLI
jgi:hypothetical protein